VDVGIFPAFGIVQRNFGDHALAHQFRLRPLHGGFKLFFGRKFLWNGQNKLACQLSSRLLDSVSSRRGSSFVRANARMFSAKSFDCRPEQGTSKKVEFSAETGHYRRKMKQNCGFWFTTKRYPALSF
jgi:hypothetical protein